MELERLSIKITADASSASKSVNTLVKSLSNLNTALGSLDTSNLEKLSSVVGELANSVSSLNSSASSIKVVASAFKDLSKSASTVKKATNATRDLSNASTELTTVSSSMGEIVTVSSTLLSVFSNMTAPMAQVASSCASVMNAFREIIQTVGILTGSTQKLIGESNIIDGTFREIVDPIQDAGKAMDEFAQKENGAAEANRNFEDSMKSRQANDLKGAPSGSDKGQSATFDQQTAAAQRTTNAIAILKSGYEGLFAVIRKIGSGFGAVAKKVASATLGFKSFEKAAKKAIASIPHATDLAKKFAKEITRVGKMLKLMITRMALRKVIEETGNGFKSLALHSEEFNQTMSNMINGSKKLGYSFAAMVAPLINALAPAIIYVINLLTKLANAIQQVFASLSGATTWNKAKDFAENWADNIKAANKQAKELKKTVLGFDELNQMQDNKSGGDTSGNIVDMFDTEKIDPKWKKFADWLKKMWDMGDFTDLGTMLGKKLRDMLESIPWDLIRSTANKLGGALATLINGFVEVERLGYDIGKTIAQSVNTVFEFLNGFVHKLHWDSIGKFIADTFNGFFEGIDWKLIKDTIVTGMTGLAETIQTFIDEFHWDNISTTIINGINTIVAGVRAFVEGIEWLELGQKMGEQITKSIEGIDWYDMGVALGDIIQAAIDWVTGMLDTMPSVDQLIEKASELLQGLFDTVDSKQLGENLAKIFNGVYNFLVGFWNENGPAIKAEVKKFFEGFWDTVDKEALKKVIGNILFAAIMGGLISLGWTTLKLFLAEKFKAMISGAVTNAAANPEVVGAAEKAGEVVFGKFAQGMIGTAATIDIWQSIKSLFKLDKLEEEMNNGKISLTEFWDSVKDLNGRAQSQASLDVLDSFRQVIRVFPDDAKRLKDELDKGIITQREYEDSLNKLAPAAKNYETELGKLIEDYQLGIIPTSEEFNEKLDTLKGKFKDAGKSVDDLKTPVIKIKDDLDQFGNKVSDNATSMDKLQSTVTTASRTIDREATTSWGNVKLVTQDAQVVLQDYEQEWAGSVGSITGQEQILVKTTDTSMSDIDKSVNTNMDDVKKSLDSVKDGMTKEKWTFSGVADGLKKTFEDAKNAIKGVWNSIADKLNGEHEIGGGKFNINLPKFAYGGFPEDGLFMANHNELVGQFSNGKTAVANNAQIVQGISAGVYNAVSSAMARNNNSNNTGYIANTIVVDGEVIARTITKAQQKQQMRFSPSMG